LQFYPSLLSEEKKEGGKGHFPLLKGGGGRSRWRERKGLLVLVPAGKKGGDPWLPVNAEEKKNPPPERLPSCSGGREKEKKPRPRKKEEGSDTLSLEIFRPFEKKKGRTSSADEGRGGGEFHGMPPSGSNGGGERKGGGAEKRKSKRLNGIFERKRGGRGKGTRPSSISGRPGGGKGEVKNRKTTPRCPSSYLSQGRGEGEREALLLGPRGYDYH